MNPQTADGLFSKNFCSVLKISRTELFVLNNEWRVC